MKTVCFRRLWPIVAVLFLISARPASAQYTNGIYAEFNTSMGSFTCRLEYALAPKACANFIGLATGQRASLNLPSGLGRTSPFYDGTTFHRVIAGFVIQGGSPNGLGTDGPGYEFTDEFTSLHHTGFGVLSMANSGPDSNGSQYFVTVSAQPQLDGVHSVFGSLFGGSNVVYDINHVATDSNSKPLTNVVVQNVIIRRVGAAAIAFDVNAQGLPVVTNVNLAIYRTNQICGLTFSNRLYADNRLYASSDLSSWSPIELGIEISAPAVTNTVSVISSAPREFFRLAQVRYAPSLFVPKTPSGRSIGFTFTNGLPGLNVAVTFTSSSGGTYTSNADGGGSVSFTWIQDAYRGRLNPILFSGTVYPMVLHLDFDSATVGTFKGTAYPNYPFTIGSGPVGGTFVATP